MLLSIRISSPPKDLRSEATVRSPRSVLAVVLFVASLHTGNRCFGQSVPAAPPAKPSVGGDTNAGYQTNTTGAHSGSGAKLSGAFLPPGPGMPGKVDLQIAGSGLASGQKVSITGPVLDAQGDVSGDEVADPVTINFRTAAQSDASLTLKTRMLPTATYTVHLLSADGTELSSTSLDLEYVVRFQTASALGSQTPGTTAGDSWWSARSKKHEASKIDRQTAANQQLMAAKMKAAEVQRQMYLFDHQTTLFLR